MITGNATWTTALAANRKRPLYSFEIPAVGMTLISYQRTLVADTPAAAKPWMYIPRGQGQQISDLDGASSISSLEVYSIDPGNTLKALLTSTALIGATAYLKLGFPGMNFADFVTLHTMQLVDSGWTSNGLVLFTLQDVQRFVKETIWLKGGPTSWSVGDPTPAQPVGASFAANTSDVSDKNPRWLQGNPIDILLVAVQNELGIGQTSDDPNAWTLYVPGDDSTLINPNAFIDVETLVALRDSAYAGDWMEFKVTRPEEGKQWLESQILKPLGLFGLIRSTGVMTWKTLKYPPAITNTTAWNDKNILGIPSMTRMPVINVVTFRMNVEQTEKSTSARTFNQEATFKQATSKAQFKQEFKHQIESNGLRAERGGFGRAALLSDHIFRRRAFGTPKYGIKTQFRNLATEVGDYVLLTHALVPDLLTGSLGISGVLCEVINRQPDYTNGTFDFELLDTRFMQALAPKLVAPAGTPAWSSESNYMFLSSGTPPAYSGGTPGYVIY